MPDIYRIENFTNGVVDAIEKKSIPPGSASRALNWLTQGDKIELRRGYKIVGSDAGTSPSKVTGLFTGHTIDGTEVTFRKRGRKLEYYDVTTSDWVEVGSDLFPADAETEDVLFDEIVNQAGAQVWGGSPNSGLYKIMVNSGKSGSGFVAPAAKDNYNASKNHKGYIKIKANRILLWRKIGDVGSIRGSYIDNLQYTTVSGEVLGTGDGGTKVFSGTLAAVTGIRTCFAIEVTDGTETFKDNRDGTLTGDQGGSGTINYSTGAISVTFAANVANLQDVTVDYQWEDSTNQGLADFTESATRVAGQGFYQPQGAGGAVQSVDSYKDIEYCLHEFASWFLDLTNDDTNANNQIWRKNAGIPNIRASVATGEGIYYVDDRNEADVRLRIMTYDSGSTEVIPISISNNLDLSQYRFDQAAMDEFGDYIVVLCRTSDSAINNRMIVYNKLWKSLDITDYYGRMFAKMNGALVVGDSLSGNVLEIFSGFDDDNALISDNYYDTNLDELQIAELKKTRDLRLGGEIQKTQKIEVWVSVDNGSYVYLGIIEGTGSYVDVGESVTIGATTIGKRPVGGGSSGTQTAYNYLRKLPFRTMIDKFQRVSVRFKATNIGYGSISLYEFYDITKHGSRVPAKYNV